MKHASGDKRNINIATMRFYDVYTKKHINIFLGLCWAAALLQIAQRFEACQLNMP